MDVADAAGLEFVDEAYVASASDRVAREALLGSLAVLAEAGDVSTERRALAARLLSGFRGLERASEFVDVEPWLAALSWGDRAGDASAASREELYRTTLIPRARQSVEVARADFTAGRGDFLELIDAQRTLLEFELARERALRDGATHRADLQRLLGGAPRSATREVNP